MSAPRSADPRPMPPERAEWVARVVGAIAELDKLIQSATWLPQHHRDSAVRDLQRVIRALEQET